MSDSNQDAPQPPPPEAGPPSRNVSSASSAMPDGSSLDHALLESLFYNEMMMLDDSNNELISTITGAASPPPPDLYSTTASSRNRSRQVVDPHTLAEKSLLDDFGVSNDPIPHITNASTSNTSAHPTNATQNQQQAWTGNSQHQQQQRQSPPQGSPTAPQRRLSKTAPKKPITKAKTKARKSSIESQPAVPVAPQQRQQQQSIAPYAHTGTVPSLVPAPAPPSQHVAYAAAPPPPPHAQHPHSHRHHPPPTYASLPAAHHPAPVPPLSVAMTTTSITSSSAAMPSAAGSKPAAHQQPPQAHHPPKQQLVGQFATLATRLGINLPPHLLQTLENATNPAEVANEISRAAESQAAHAAYHPAHHHPHYPPPPHHYPYAHHHPHHPHPAYHHHPHYPPPHPYTTMHHPPPPPATSPTAAPPSTTTSTSAPPTAPPTLSYSNGIKHALQPQPPPPVASSSSPAPAPTPHIVQELRKTAEDAIAAVTTKKRSYADLQQAAAEELAAESDAGRHNKRKKKPRLSDCESRLAQLQSENELLKRHLDNITNKTHKFEQERSMVEENMKRMVMTKGVPDKEIEKVILEYADMYSDYGRRRHEELSFHLEQLQKLANPTNFTKMGLWAVARANRKSTGNQNPIIGILQKELDINPQQIRKILDQQQKIRGLCTNLHACLVLLGKLKDLCGQKNKIFSDRMNKTREILTPRQVMKLIMFVKEHTDVLGDLCPGWTSEQIVKAKEAKAVATLSSVAAMVDAQSSTVRSSDTKLPPVVAFSSEVLPTASPSNQSTATASTPQGMLVDPKASSGEIKQEEAAGAAGAAPASASSSVPVTNGSALSKEGGTPPTGCTPIAPNTDTGTAPEGGTTPTAAAAALSIPPLVK